MELHVDSRRVLAALVVTTFSLSVLHVLTQAAILAALLPNGHPLAQGFNLDHEPALPTFFAVILWIAASLLCVLVALGSRRTDTLQSRWWAVLSTAFAFLAADEFIGIHEAVSVALQPLPATGGFFYNGWLLPYGLATVGGLVGSRRFLLRLPRETRRRIVVATGMFLAGSLVVESFAGRHVEMYGREEPWYRLCLVPLEETLENLGLALLISALFSHLGEIHPPITLRFAPPANGD